MLGLAVGSRQMWPWVDSFHATTLHCSALSCDYKRSFSQCLLAFPWRSVMVVVDVVGIVVVVVVVVVTIVVNAVAVHTCRRGSW